jgi:hypothetical protein
MFFSGIVFKSIDTAGQLGKNGESNEFDGFT